MRGYTGRCGCGNFLQFRFRGFDNHLTSPEGGAVVNQPLGTCWIVELRRNMV